MRANVIDILNDIHGNLVGNEELKNLTDLDKIINILEIMAEKIEDLDNHQHTIH